jgi:hypothetical protein
MNEFVIAYSAGIGLILGPQRNNCNISRMGGILTKAP